MSTSEENQEQKVSIASQGLWLLFAKVVGFGLSFILPLMVYRILTKAEVGTYNQVFLIIVMVSGILPFGVSMSAFYYLARDKNRKPFYIFNILLFNFIIGGLAFLFLNIYPQILQNLFNNPKMAEFAPQIGLVIWLWVFSTFFEIVAIANQEARIATVFIISAQLTKAVFMISAVWYWGTVGAMLNAASLQAILETIALFIYLSSRFKGFWHSFDKTLFIEQLRYAIPFGLMGILWTLQVEIHNLFIGNGFSEEEYAVYRAGCFELPLLFLLQESISSVMIPRMSVLQAEDNKREMINLTARAMEKLSLAYFPAFMFFLITAHTFITTLFTKNYADSVPIFLINIIILPTAIMILDPIVRAYSPLGKFVLNVRIFIVVLLFVTLYYGIHHFNLIGMAMIVVATSLIDRFITTIKIWRTIGVKTSDIYLLKNVGKIGLATIIAGIPTYFAYHQIKQLTPNLGHQISLLLSDLLSYVMSYTPKETFAETITGFLTLGFTGVIFATVYLTGLYLLRVLADDEKEFIRLKFLEFRKFLRLSQS